MGGAVMGDPDYTLRLTRDAAKEALIAMTRAGMTFDGNANEGKGALLFKTDRSSSFREAYLAIAGVVNGGEIKSHEVSALGKITHYEIRDENIVKQMAGHCVTGKFRSIG